jgi:hypothetical protein
MGLVVNGWSMDTVDHSLYGDLLKKYVKNGIVNYQGFKDEEANLDQYLKVLEQTNTQELSRNEQLAFYINAYNAWTIKLVLSGYPGIKSIKALGSIFKSPWKKEIARIDGQVISLDDIEHGIIRPRFQDPRIHFAVNCAAKSCPPLISEPYWGNTLDQQLDASTRAFINDPASNRMEGNVLRVSKIFDWYEKDFKEGIIPFFENYAEGNLKENLEAYRGQIKIKYFAYDWALNGA